MGMIALNPVDFRKFIAGLFLPQVVPVFATNQQIDTTNIPAYVTVQQVTSTPQGQSIYMVGEQEYARIRSNVLYSINIIGKNAIMMANRLHPTLRLTKHVNELKKLNIGILQMSAIRDVSGAFDSGFEERAQFDLLVSQDTIVNEQLNNINSVDFDLHVEQ